MGIAPPRWTEVTPSEFPWEREGLDFVRDLLPDVEPYRAWSSFTFVAADGSTNEVDLLVITPKGVFLVELKHWAGDVAGDQSGWVRERGPGRVTYEDNPLLLANRKAKRLKALLEDAYRRIQPSRSRNAAAAVPWMQEKIFLSHPTVTCSLDPNVARHVHTRADIEAALTELGPDHRGRRLTKEDAKALTAAMDHIGLKPSRRRRTVGEYELEAAPLGEGPGFQDWAAKHRSLGTRRRVRIYTVPPALPESKRRIFDQAAKAQYKLLEGISHEGIMRALDFCESEMGPALVFEDDADDVRLDHYLNEHRDELDFEDRMRLLRQLAEALRYAHGKGLTHRALSPTAVLVRGADSPSPHVQIRNWQTGHRGPLHTSHTSGTRLTRHFVEITDQDSRVYSAPELGAAGYDPVLLDVFSLGALAWFLFTGRPPAQSFNGLLKLVHDNDGLQLASALDGVPAPLADLVFRATRGRATERFASMDELIAALDDIELAMSPAAEPGGEADETSPQVVDDPTDASVGEVLEGGFVVTHRLGSGSTSVVYTVTTPAGTESVLKLAAEPRYNERLRAEAEVLAKLRHHHIVAYDSTVEIGGLVGLLIGRAGTVTLRRRLREDGPLSLDMLERFGEQLLDALQYLERQGIAHRDVKPENIGVRENPSSHQTEIVLFDFSLSRVPSEQIEAGTAGYIDPFVGTGERQRWDLQAERYAAAVTLHEMASAALPQWGDGRSNPAVTADTVVLATDLFPRDVREPLSQFFTKAMARKASDRFDNAELMRAAWRACFATIDTPTLTPDDTVESSLADIVSRARPTDPLVALGCFSGRAQNALDRLGIETVRDLLETPSMRILQQRGVGQKTRREIARVQADLAARFPEIERKTASMQELGSLSPHTWAETPQSVQSDDDDASAPEPDWTIEAVAAALVPQPGRRGSKEPEVLRTFLGRASGEPWPAPKQVAAAVGVTAMRVYQVVAKARDRWRKLDLVTEARDEVAAILADLGGVATAAEVAAELAGRVGADDPATAGAAALAVLRAATETEIDGAEPRWTYGRTSRSDLVLAVESAGGTAAVRYAEALGDAADALAAQDPLPGAQRVVADLSAVPLPASMTPPAPDRLVRLAAAASATAATAETRLEIYPRGLPAARALRLAYPALLGVTELTPQKLAARVAARYPGSAPLPDRPALDALITEVGLDLTWHAAAAGGQGAYKLAQGSMSGLTTWHPSKPRRRHRRTTTTAGMGLAPGTDATAFDERLDAALAEGVFLALRTYPGRADEAAAAIAVRFGVETVSIEAVLLAQMRAVAADAGADWSVVVAADAAEHGSGDWARLMSLVTRAIPAVEAALAAHPDATVLLTRPGLLARYGCLDVLERIRDRVGRSGADGLAGRWMLVAGDDQSGAPVVDGAALPVLTANQSLPIPTAWLDAVAALSRGGAA